jgi:hypothetical protein
VELLGSHHALQQTLHCLKAEHRCVALHLRFLPVIIVMMYFNPWCPSNCLWPIVERGVDCECRVGVVQVRHHTDMIKSDPSARIDPV